MRPVFRFLAPPASPARRHALHRLLLAGGGTLVAGAGIGACAPLALINGLVPGDTHRQLHDLDYGVDPRQHLDVYLPAAASAAPRTMVLFFYGGAWTSGARADYRFAGEAFAAAGFVTAVPDYRLHPQVRYPDFIADCAAATAWMQRHAARFGGDPERIVLIGHSAGAYNAAMLAYAPHYLAHAGASARAVRGFVGLAGPYDFLPLGSAATRAIFGHPDTPPATQPIHHVRNAGSAPGLPPALLLTAIDDNVVAPGNSARLAAALRAAGSSAVEIAYPSLDHRRLVGALAAPLRHLAPVRDDILRFIAALA